MASDPPGFRINLNQIIELLVAGLEAKLRASRNRLVCHALALGGDSLRRPRNRLPGDDLIILVVATGAGTLTDKVPVARSAAHGPLLRGIRGPAVQGWDFIFLWLDERFAVGRSTYVTHPAPKAESEQRCSKISVVTNCRVASQQ